MGTIKPDYTFLMYLNVNKSILRISNRKTINTDMINLRNHFIKKFRMAFLKFIIKISRNT